LKYYKITTKSDWFIIPVNDVWRAKKMLGADFISSELHREWRHPNNDRNKFDSFNTDAYNKWKKENNA